MGRTYHVKSPSTSDASRIVREMSAIQKRLGSNENGQLKDLNQALSRLNDSVKLALHDVVVPGSADTFDGDIQHAQLRLSHMVDQSSDLILRTLQVGVFWRWPALLVFVDGLVGNEMVDQDTVERLTRSSFQDTPDPQTVFATVKSLLVTVGHVSTEKSWKQITTKALTGNAVLFLEGMPEVLVLDTVKFPARAIPATEIEPSVKGPQEAFNEVRLTHMDQLRRWIRSPDLHFDAHTVGTISKSPVTVAYIHGVVNGELLDRVTDRIERVDRAMVTCANDLGEYLSAHRVSIFPQYRLTERVDWVARQLGQGKIAVLVENDPFAIVLPVTLIDFYQTTQDYAMSWWDGTLVRLIRFAGLIVGLYLMPLYIALTSVNTDLVPTPLLLTIDGSRQGIPFPPVVEVVIMYVIIEILREAANRLPKQLAVTLGTVGAVVVGTAIVKAGIVDDVMIVSATLTALGLFTSPAFEMSTPWRWLFWVMIAGAYFLGILGMVLVTVGIIAYLASMEEFGVPYLTPFGPVRLGSWSDAWLRLPTPTLKERPISLRPERTRDAHTDAPPDPFQLGPRGER